MQNLFTIELLRLPDTRKIPSRNKTSTEDMWETCVRFIFQAFHESKAV